MISLTLWLHRGSIMGLACVQHLMNKRCCLEGDFIASCMREHPVGQGGGEPAWWRASCLRSTGVSLSILPAFSEGAASLLMPAWSVKWDCVRKSDTMPALSLPPVSLATETAGIQEPVTCVQPSQPASEGALCLANASDWLAKPYLPQRAEGMQSVGLQPWQSQTDSARGDSSPPLCDGMGRDWAHSRSPQGNTGLSNP